MYEKLINSAGQWLKVEKSPHYPKELSHPALSPSSLKEAFIVSLVVAKFMSFWSSIFHNSVWENGATHFQFSWARESDSLIPLFADVIDKLCQGWEGGRSCVSCKVTRKCAACGLWLTAWQTRFSSWLLQSPFGASWGCQALILLSSSKNPLSDNTCVLMISIRCTGAFRPCMSMLAKRKEPA